MPRYGLQGSEVSLPTPTLALLTLAGREIPLAIDLCEYDRLHDLENAHRYSLRVWARALARVQGRPEAIPGQIT